MYEDDDDPRSANLPASGLSKGAIVLAALASVGVATLVYILFTLVSLIF